jgi:hypothetical protein
MLRYVRDAAVVSLEEDRERDLSEPPTQRKVSLEISQSYWNLSLVVANF